MLSPPGRPVHKDQRAAGIVNTTQVFCFKRRRRGHDETVHPLIQEHLDGVDFCCPLLIGVDKDDVVAALLRGVGDASCGQAEVRVLNVPHHHADSVRSARIHAAGELVGPVLQLLGGRQYPLAYILADGAVVAQRAGGLGLGHLGGLCDIRDRDVATPGTITVHFGLPERALTAGVVWVTFLATRCESGLNPRV